MQNIPNYNAIYPGGWITNPFSAMTRTLRPGKFVRPRDTGNMGLGTKGNFASLDRCGNPSFTTKTAVDPLPIPSLSR